MILINAQPHSLGQALYVARTKAGLTQVKLAARVGIHHSRISEWERGRITISACRWLQLMLACGWTIEAKR